MTGDTWLRIRFGLGVFNFVVALIIPAEQFEEFKSFPTWMLAVVGVFAIVTLGAIPLVLLLVIGIQAINPLSDDKWTAPTHRSNPFRLGNPLLFFHFVAFVFGASGLGLLVSSPWKGLIVAAHGILVVLGSIMMLVGVRLCMRVFKDKMMQALPNQTDADERA